VCACDTERLLRTSKGQQEPAANKDHKSADLARCASAVDAYRTLIKRSIVGYCITAVTVHPLFVQQQNVAQTALGFPLTLVAWRIALIRPS
jgi:hypothetical protein